MTSPQAIAPDLWVLPTSASNAYLWRTTAARFIVVDPGLYGDESAVLDAVAELGGNAHDVASIVLTHFHSDHAGAASALAAATGAPVCAAPRDAAVLRGETPRPLPDLTATERPLYERIAASHPGNLEAPRCAVSVELEHGDPVDDDEELIVHAVTGHTWGSIAVHIPRRSAVLTGDIAVSGPGGEVTLGPFNVDRRRARRALARLATLNARVAGVGHGQPLLRGAHEALRHAGDAASASSTG
ncbi:MBL fold metallo-hydrolase [Mangrovihabitans endophyticus]|uniref:MBL fold metallo-hydrolase n=1 Tax=Mangrovihabitans endophyticus TaxID=1751298 RepID=A0A8J3BSB6_9ACTN|nr:MBL fold metallo-hydrolase [Mangrovihabitans endophyticus]GGK73717.1 MBL fold metallo-hydrolase [Mangrovihabitans endophyticus]